MVKHAPSRCLWVERFVKMDKKRFNYFRKQGGFTLIEVLFSITLFGVILIGLIPAFVFQLRMNTLSELRSNAAMAAQAKLDELRFTNITDIPASGSSAEEDIAIGDRVFQVITHYCETAAYCATGNNRQVRVAVTYNGEPQYAVETVYTRLQ